MELSDLALLRQPEVDARLADLTATPITEQNHLRLLTRLRRELGADAARAMVEQAQLRQRAREKFVRSDQMYFTRIGLEQATPEIVARHRAARFAALAPRIIADLGCGIGGDGLALAAVAPVVGVDRSRLRLELARTNAAVYGAGERFWPLQADLLTLPPLAVEALFYDPARRDATGRRLHSVETYRPPLSLIDAWREVTPAAAVKISPGVNYGEVPAQVEVEFVELNGQVREATLWYGALRSGVSRRATLLPAGVTLTDAAPVETIPQSGPRAYLYEPAGAVIRAHLVEHLATRLGAAQLDPTIAYLTADRLQDTPLARAYAIEDTFPFQLKRLRAYLRERRVGIVTIKKRGSPLDPDRLRRRLRLSGENACTIFLTQVAGEPTVLVGQPAGTDQKSA